MVENFDPNTIEDEGLRQVFITLMNLVETLSAKVQEQAEEIQRLRDEIRRLKGEQDTPTFPLKKPAPLLSSEKERHASKPHRKAHKHAQIRIDRVEILTIDPGQLPADAQFKGYEDVVVQDVTFRKERYYSPSQKRTYQANLPTGYHGQFGPGVRAWVLALYYAAGDERTKNRRPVANGGNAHQCGTDFHLSDCQPGRLSRRICSGGPSRTRKQPMAAS